MKAPRDATKPSLDSVVGALGLATGVVGLAAASLLSIADRKWANAAAYGLFTVTIGVVLAAHLLRRKPAPPIQTTTFVPFTTLTSETTWPRPAEVNSITSTLRKDRGTLPIVIGASGAGKTMLLRVLVPKTLARTKRRTVYIASYEDVYERLDRELEGNSPARSIIVFDQFERWLSQLSDFPADERRAEQDRMRKRLQRSLSPTEPTILLSLRQEWYYDLRFLGSLVPPLDRCCHIEGGQLSEPDDSMRTAINVRLRMVLPDRDTADEVLARLGSSGNILPLEAQIVGAALEREVANHRRVTLRYFDDELGGVPGAIDRFFDEALAGAPNKLVALEVLCALSARTKFRRQEYLDRIFDRLYEDHGAIGEAIDYLEGQHLIIRHPGGRCELTHDYLALYFNAKSGAELNPVTRDNILFHLQAESRENSAALRPASIRQERSRLGQKVVIPLVVLMAIRLFHFGLDWTLLGSLPPRLLRTNFMDAAYVPIFVPHAAWIAYIGVFYDRFLSRLRESRLAKAFSVFTVLNLIVCVLLGIFVPFCWLVSIGWGGTVLGIKLVMLSRRKDFNRAATDRLRVFGIVTLFNLIFLLGLGVILMYLSFLLVDDQETGTKWLLINLFFSAMMTYACWALARVHVYPPAISQILGLVGRARTAVIPRVEG